MMMVKVKLALSFLLFVSAHAGVEDSVSSDRDCPSVVIFVKRLIDVFPSNGMDAPWIHEDCIIKASLPG